MSRSLSTILLLFTALAVSGPAPAHAATPNCDIWWNEVRHDTFDPAYRTPSGPVTPGTTVRLRLRVAQSDLTSVRVRVWNDRTDTSNYYAMTWDGAFDTDPATYDWWVVDLPAGSQPTVLYYFFELNDGPGWCTADQDFYVDDDPKFYGGGPGTMSDGYDDSRSYQVTVYDPSFASPEWMQRGITYQVFPDRFRDGVPANDPITGTFHYGANSSIARSGGLDWNAVVCDPRNLLAPACPNHWSDNFYGGDLAGLADKVEQGYFDMLGVSVLYLTPIFASPSNHKYDTADYRRIDPAFGTAADFARLEQATESRGIKLVLDGVFNHTSSDSRYFDLYCRYDANGTLVSPGAACATMNDQDGACEARSSARRGWFYFDESGPAPAPNEDSCYPKPPGVRYTSWFGYTSLPKLNSSVAGVRDLVWSAGLNSAAPYWTAQGADGWRLDVGGDVDPGLTNDPGNSYWEGFRSAVRDPAVTGKNDTLVIGEEWGDGTAWLLGNEWDSVMNYRFRSAMLGWSFNGCAGNGCSGGTTFYDNDSDSGSSSGAIARLSASQLDLRLRSIAEDYPAPALRAAMNLGGSHDTNRLRFLLRKINNDDDAAARARMTAWWTLAFAYPGSPTIYYGDEIGLSQDGVFAGGKWEDDPYNRAPFPWPDASGSAFVADTALLARVRELASMRHAVRALQDGDVHHGRIVDDAARLYGFGRTLAGGGGALCAVNADVTAHAATFTGLNAAPFAWPDGTQLEDARSGARYTVSSGAVTVSVPGVAGVILVDPAHVDAPAPAMGRDLVVQGADRVVSWAPVIRDDAGGHEVATRYEVHRGSSASFSPGPATLLGSVEPPPFGVAGGRLRFIDAGGANLHGYYLVRAFNALRRASDSAVFSPELCDGADNDGDGSVDDTPVPPAPVGPTLTVTKAAGSVTLHWLPATRAPLFGVYRSTSPSGLVTPAHRIAETADLLWTDTPPAASIQHYLVTARDTCGGETP